MRRQREQLAVGRDVAAMRQREENASRGRARQLSGARDVAQGHRARGLAEHLQQPQTAVEALDEIGGALLAVLAFQLWHRWILCLRVTFSENRDPLFRITRANRSKIVLAA